MACLSAARATGSPSLAASLPYQERASPTSLRSSATTRPVSMSPQVDALTSSESLSPRWSSQAPLGILSAMSRSAVSAIRDSQQGFGEAHEDHAFAGCQTVLTQEGIERTAAAARAAHRLDERQRARSDAARGRIGQPRVIREFSDKCLFFGEITRVDGPSYGIGPLQRGKMCHGRNSIELSPLRPNSVAHEPIRQGRHDGQFPVRSH